MATETGSATSVPWWKEPTKDQWLAWWAAWLGWTLDAFDFTVFLLHQGAIWGGFVAPIVTFFAINYELGFAIPMLIGTVVGCISFIIALLLGPETKGKVLVPDLLVT